MQGGVALAPTTYVQADEEYLPLKEKSVDRELFADRCTQSAPPMARHSRSALLLMQHSLPCMQLLQSHTAHTPGEASLHHVAACCALLKEGCSYTGTAVGFVC